MDLSRYFKKDEQIYEGITIFDFDDGMAEEFIVDCIVPFRRAYVSDKQLDYEVELGLWSKEKAIARRIPSDKPALKSGEFSEILTCFLAKEFLAHDANLIPMKWRWKENQNMPSHLTDVILLRCDDRDNPDAGDYICSIEVKSVATKYPKGKIHEALKGAINDRDSRVAKTIAFLETKYAMEHNPDKVLMVKRFEDSVNRPYARRFNAAIVANRSFMSNMVADFTDEDRRLSVQEKIAMIAVPLGDLKKIYESIYALMPSDG